MDKEYVKNSRLGEMEKSGVLCVSMCDRPPRAIFSLPSVFGGRTCKVLNRITRSTTEKTHTKKCEVVQACTDTSHTRADSTHRAVLPDTHVYRQGRCWGKGLVAGQRSGRWDFMANAEIGPLVRERGLTEVDKQRQSQMETLDKQTRITGEGGG